LTFGRGVVAFGFKGKSGFDINDVPQYPQRAFCVSLSTLNTAPQFGHFVDTSIALSY
jgi:hypothetical protein